MENKHKTFTIKLEEEVLNKLTEICKNTGLKKQVIASKAIKCYLDTLEQSDAVKFLSKTNIYE